MPLVRQIPSGGLSAPTTDWPLLAEDAAIPASGPVLVPLAAWLAEADTLKSRPDTGVWLAAGDDPAALGTLPPVVAIRFAAFTDGRGYSQARMLRDRLGFTGELRAVGDVLIDQVRFLARSGFDAFQVAGGTDLARFAAALDHFSVVYQTAADRLTPAAVLRHASQRSAAE
ncbi:MAG: DUF934 domain-containing protein [Rhodospirillaceae bacterium]